MRALDTEKHGGGGGSCVASKAASHFPGGEGLPHLHLSLFHMSYAHKLSLSVVVLEGCLCLFQVCICLKKEPTILFLSALCFNNMAQGVGELMKPELT